MVKIGSAGTAPWYIRTAVDGHPLQKACAGGFVSWPQACDSNRDPRGCVVRAGQFGLALRAIMGGTHKKEPFAPAHEDAQEMFSPV
jgi:hypothetical protein